MRKSLINITFSLLALVLVAAGTAHGQIGQGLLQAGPTANGPLALFPSYYMDKDGLALEPCLDGSANCLLATLADLNVPDGSGEAFYWMAVADMAGGVGGSSGSVEMAIEMAFLGTPLDLTTAQVFNRLRIRIDNLPAGGVYTITFPFGAKSVAAEAVTGNRGPFRINDTTDLPGSTGLASFSGVLNVRRVGPFLRQVGTGAQPYLGSPDVAARVRGGTNGNRVIVTHPTLGTVMSTNLFTILGKKATNGGLTGTKASFTRNAAGQKVVTVRASSIGQQAITATIGPGARVVALTPVVGQIGNYSATVNMPANAVLEPLVVTNTSDVSLPSVTFNPVPDVITITRATWLNGVLTVQAQSGETVAPRPLLTLTEPVSNTQLGTPRRGKVNVTIPSPFKPARIRVTSELGGAAGAVVR